MTKIVYIAEEFFSGTRPTWVAYLEKKGMLKVSKTVVWCNPQIGEIRVGNVLMYNPLFGFKVMKTEDFEIMKQWFTF